MRYRLDLLDLNADMIFLLWFQVGIQYLMYWAPEKQSFKWAPEVQKKCKNKML